MKIVTTKQDRGHLTATNRKHLTVLHSSPRFTPDDSTWWKVGRIRYRVQADMEAGPNAYIADIKNGQHSKTFRATYRVAT